MRRIWRHNIDIKQFLNKSIYHDYPTFKMVKELVEYLETDEVAKKIIPKRFVVSFKNVIGKDNDDDRVDRIMERLYDYADDNDIWLGL